MVDDIRIYLIACLLPAYQPQHTDTKWACYQLTNFNIDVTRACYQLSNSNIDRYNKVLLPTYQPQHTDKTRACYQLTNPNIDRYNKGLLPNSVGYSSLASADDSSGMISAANVKSMPTPQHTDSVTVNPTLLGTNIKHPRYLHVNLQRFMN